MVHTLGLVLVGAIGLLNLLLLVGVLARLKDHTATIEELAGGRDSHEGVAKPGTTIGEFDAIAVDGSVIGRHDLERGDVVAFFSPTCGPCIERVPQFATYASQLARTGATVVAVVVGDPGQAREMIETLTPGALVVTAARPDPIVTAFEASGYPAIYLVGADHTVAASGHTMGVLPALVPA